MIALTLFLADVLHSVLFKRCSVVGDDDDVAIFDLPRDVFNGVTLDTALHAVGLDDRAFRAKLSKSIDIWQRTQVGAVTIYVRLPDSRLVSVCASLGFECHHAKPDYVFMLRWLPPDRPCKFPRYGSAFVGVGGLVVNEREEMLVVRERYYRRPHWKLPGGLAEPGEDLNATAVREVFEETGIATRFVCVVAFRHAHAYQFGCADFYFVCLLRPLRRGLVDADIRVEEAEIAQCRWMPVDEYLDSALVSEANRFIVERYVAIRDRFTSDDEHPPTPPVPPLHIPPDVPSDRLLNGIEMPGFHDHEDAVGNNVDAEDRGDDSYPPILASPASQSRFAIVQRPVPSYDGRSTNMSYSVDRILLD